jgi:hypothetical protein
MLIVANRRLILEDWAGNHIYVIYVYKYTHTYVHTHAHTLCAPCGCDFRCLFDGTTSTRSTLNTTAEQRPLKQVRFSSFPFFS